MSEQNQIDMQKVAGAVQAARFDYFTTRFAKHAAARGISFKTDEELVKAAATADYMLSQGAQAPVEKTASEPRPLVEDEFDKEAAEQFVALADVIASL